MRSINEFQQLPPAREHFLPQIAFLMKEREVTVIVLDDDPTGTQTVHDLPVLTTWNFAELQAELARGTSMFYILTNSRSLSSKDAQALARQIGRNIQLAAESLGKKIWVISRSDSTLRGHYPGEVDALEKSLDLEQSVRFLIPAFFEGGRYTYHDIHYVQEGNDLIPAADTPFAQDPSFGYRHSNLKDWVAEKTQNKVKASSVISFSVEELRKGEVADLVKKLNACPPGTTCIVNAIAYGDLEVFAFALLQSRVQPLCRTAAGFTAVLMGRKRRGLLQQQEIVGGEPGRGGLIVVGSFVPKSSRQLAHLQENLNVESIELDVKRILEEETQETLIRFYSNQINQYLKKGKDVVFFTSRELIHFKQEKKQVSAGQRISHLIAEVVRHLSLSPAFLIAKGGITSSDIATQSLGIKRAMVQGQILAGIPVWKLGAEAKFPGMSYIVFPGNVGSDSALSEAVQKLKIQEL